MKLTKSFIKQVIKEELSNLQEMGASSRYQTYDRYGEPTGDPYIGEESPFSIQWRAAFKEINRINNDNTVSPEEKIKKADEIMKQAYAGAFRKQ